MKTNLNFLAIITTLLFSFSAVASGKNGSTLTAVTGTLQDVSQMVAAGKKFAETKFEQHSSGGSGAKTSVPQLNLIGGGTASGQNANPFVSIFQMMPNYIIAMKLNPDSKAGGTITLNGGTVVNVTNPVAQTLLGVEFVFTPIYNQGDNKITSWACFTNADYYKSEYMQQNAMPVYERSYIAAAAEEAGVVDLSKCIYMGPNLRSYITPYSAGDFQ